MTYFRDWFGRDADYGYTYYDPKKRTISWDKGYTNYSDFFFGSQSKVNVEEAASLIRTMSQVMGVDRSKFTVHKSINNVQIPAHLLKLKDVSSDVFIGASLQSMAKHVHQDQTTREFYHKASTGKPSLLKLVQTILNEERVNKLMADETPGYLRFVQKYKEHKYKQRPEPANDGEHLLDLFDRIIRYPEQITEEELEKFKEPIDKIKKILTATDGIPTDFEECTKAGKRITKIIQDYVKDEESKEDSESETGAGGGGGGSGEDTAPSAHKPKLDMEKFIDKMAIAMDEPALDEGESFQKFIEEMKSLDEIESKSEGQKKVDYIVVQADMYSDAEYNHILNSIDRTKAGVLGTLLRRKSRDYQFSLRSMRSGRLDTNKLAEAVQGVPTIYERIGEVKTNKLCVTILVDESGSMHGNKEKAARQAAIFLNEALKNVPDVELFIYGHTADIRGGGYNGMPPDSCSGSSSTQLLIYKEPGLHNTTQMGHISAKYENRDGTAIMAAAKRVRTKTSNTGVFIIISDGSPHAYNYSGEKAKKHVKRMANETEQMGFEVIQVTIGDYRSHDMFKNVIKMEDVSKFPDQFVAFLKKKMNKMIKEKVIL